MGGEGISTGATGLVGSIGVLLALLVTASEDAEIRA